MNPTLPLGPGREFDLIRQLVSRLGPTAAGIGDDAAVLDLPAGERLVVSTDASVEDVHFRRGWLEAREVGYRAVAAALSDLAAMAATPAGILVALAMPERWTALVGELADGIADAATLASAPVVGGNITAAAQLSLTVTVLGHATRPLGRGGAQPGDVVYVTGTLGAPLLAVRAWEAGRAPEEAHRQRFARPTPRISEARWLASRGARAAIDISDGLAADLRHLAAASGVTVRVELESVPCVPGMRPMDALASGEEYEIAVTTPHELDQHEFARRFGVALTRIGAVEPDESAALVRIRAGGTFVDPPAGHDHFSR